MAVPAQAIGLEAIGVRTLEDALAAPGRVVRVYPNRRDVMILDVPETADGVRRLFMKRTYQAKMKDGLRTLLSHGRVWSNSREEFENLRLLQKAGIPACKPVAFGEECSLLREKFSFLVTEAVPAEQTLLDFLEACHDGALRRRVIESAARLVRQLHRSGMAWPDLYSRHIFVKVTGEQVRMWLIDVPRLEQPWLMTPVRRARDLANFNISVPLACCGMKERMRFLRAYEPDGAPLLWLALRLRMRRLARSKRARKFGYLKQAATPA